MKRSYLGIFLVILGILMLIPMFRGLYDYAVSEATVAEDAVFGMDWLFFHFLMGVASILLRWVGVRFVKASRN